MQNIIYGLMSTKNDMVYYVGKTTYPKQRPLSHLKKTSTIHVNNWVSEMEDKGVIIEAVVLEVVESEDDLREREIFWIQHYSLINKDILNVHHKITLNNSYSQLDKDKFAALFHLILHCGDIIKKERLARNISQEELSGMANMSRSTLSLLERNENVNLFTLRDLIMALKAIDMDDRIIHHIGTNSSKKAS